MAEQNHDHKSEFALLELCSAKLVEKFPLGELCVLGDGTLVEVVGVGGVSFRPLAVPIRYAVVADPEQLAEEEIDLHLLGFQTLPETEFTCEHGTVPIDARNSGRIVAAQAEDWISELRDQTFNVKDGLHDDD